MRKCRLTAALLWTYSPHRCGALAMRQSQSGDAYRPDGNGEADVPAVSERRDGGHSTTTPYSQDGPSGSRVVEPDVQSRARGLAAVFHGRALEPHWRPACRLTSAPDGWRVQRGDGQRPTDERQHRVVLRVPLAMNSTAARVGRPGGLGSSTSPALSQQGRQEPTHYHTQRHPDRLCRGLRGAGVGHRSATIPATTVNMGGGRKPWLHRP